MQSTGFERRLVAVVMAGLFWVECHAQGTVWLANRLYTPEGQTIIDAPVINFVSGLLVAGPDYVARLYSYSYSSPEVGFTAVGPVVGLGSGPLTGYWEPVVVAIEGHEPGERVNLVVRLWAMSDGASFEAAWQAGGQVGTWGFQEVVLGGGGQPPAYLIGSPPIYVAFVPEPDPLSLGLVGLALLVIGRCRSRSLARMSLPRP
jgi:hypothetical protein